MSLPVFCIIPLSGACAGIAFWTVALPLDAVKTLVQTSESSWRQAYQQISFARIYKTGYTMALARGIPGSSITFTIQTLASQWIDRNILLQKQGTDIG
jgi:Mitochondrial carrier protein